MEHIHTNDIHINIYLMHRHIWTSLWPGHDNDNTLLENALAGSAAVTHAHARRMPRRTVHVGHRDPSRDVARRVRQAWANPRWTIPYPQTRRMHLCSIVKCVLYNLWTSLVMWWFREHDYRKVKIPTLLTGSASTGLCNSCRSICASKAPSDTIWSRNSICTTLRGQTNTAVKTGAIRRKWKITLNMPSKSHVESMVETIRQSLAILHPSIYFPI